jgi:KDO2-lipid IV(A) lauroyltransferase
MTRSRSRTVDYAAYLLVRAAEMLVQAVPPSVAQAIARFLAWVGYCVDRRHREVALENLRHAFPGRYSEDELRRMVLDVYRHWATMLLELALLRRKAQSARWWAELTAASEPLYRPYRDSGRPLLLVTAHYGNWELGAFQLRAAGLPAHIVARPLDNPYLDERVHQFREMFGHTVLSKQTDLWRMYDVLRSGGTVCTMADQDAGPKGLFVDFFGRPASTHRVMAILAQSTNALIGVIGNRSTGELFGYEPLVLDVIDVSDYAGHPDATRAITQRMTAAIEDLVRGDPRQYLWLHRRWKHQPPETAAREAA